MQETLGLIERSIKEVSEALNDKKLLEKIVKSDKFPKVTINPNDHEKEGYDFTSDELIRCLRSLNNARKNLTNLGIKYEEKVQTQGQVIRQPIGGNFPQVRGTPITS